MKKQSKLREFLDSAVIGLVVWGGLLLLGILVQAVRMGYRENPSLALLLGTSMGGCVLCSFIWKLMKR